MKPITKMMHNFLEGNPQLFREIKGRLKTRNVVIVALLAIATQALIGLIYFSQLPSSNTKLDQYSRYCFKIVDPYYRNHYACETDLVGNWMINWQLLWLDIFITLSVVGIFGLLVAGTYLLIADVTQEESRGTLNFIRLSPQSATSILLGKILGVPILLYLFVLVVLPFHLVAGLGAKIPISLWLAFDAVIVASCAFFYSFALLFSFINSKLPGFKPWVGSGVVLFFLFITNIIIFNSYSVSNTPGDWLTLFHPGIVLPYLVDATYLPHQDVYSLEVKNIAELLFYGQTFWHKASSGIGLVFLNYCLWTYWLWQGLKRRFHNPVSTLFNKTQSYWFTGCFTAVALGFTLQTTKEYRLFENFSMLQCFLVVMFLGLIAALSPHRQTLQDWARYRHQLRKEGKHLWQELVFGEKSPSTVAISINLSIAIVYTLPCLVLFSFEDKTLPALWGLILTANMILLYAAIAQWFLTIKTPRRAIWATVTIFSLIVLPPFILGISRFDPHSSPLIWLFTFIPSIATEYTTMSTVIVSILGQWLAIALVSLQMTRQLRQAGASETKILLSQMN
ncbi:hypothetical protein STA3757_32840 [Stanieria sp. NIES-3757]|nr:hypothetical protein STA3757_32840 [Stanieria sp. NIES-3757]